VTVDACPVNRSNVLRLEGAGHGLYRADWEAIVAATLGHT
jgi:hypothetical protein